MHLNGTTIVEIHLPTRFKIFGGGVVVLAVLTTSSRNVQNVIFQILLNVFQNLNPLPSLLFLKPNIFYSTCLM